MFPLSLFSDICSETTSLKKFCHKLNASFNETNEYFIINLDASSGQKNIMSQMFLWHIHYYNKQDSGYVLCNNTCGTYYSVHSSYLILICSLLLVDMCARLFPGTSIFKLISNSSYPRFWLSQHKSIRYYVTHSNIIMCTLHYSKKKCLWLHVIEWKGNNTYIRDDIVNKNSL